VLPREGRYIEPFAGGAAVWLNGPWRDCTLSDVNGHLMDFYRVLADRSDELVESAASLFTTGCNTREAYGRLRDEFNETGGDPLRRAALFLYLNRHGFNGLCRYSAGGRFNVAFGNYRRPRFPLEEIRSFVRRMAESRTRIRTDSFEALLSSSGAGDVVYCDPPYVPLGQTANFTKYARGGRFRGEQQEKVAELARAAAARGAFVAVSNHDLPATRVLYEGAVFHAFDLRRPIGRTASGRFRAPEILAVFDGRAKRR
jgi:DNA adenine methylase